MSLPSQKTPKFWESMPAMEGAVEFAQELGKHFELVVLTSMPVRFEQARMRNLLALGMPVSKVIAIARGGEENPKNPISLERINRGSETLEPSESPKA